MTWFNFKQHKLCTKQSTTVRSFPQKTNLNKEHETVFNPFVWTIVVESKDLHLFFKNVHLCSKSPDFHDIRRKNNMNTTQDSVMHEWGLAYGQWRNVLLWVNWLCVTFTDLNDCLCDLYVTDHIKECVEGRFHGKHAMKSSWKDIHLMFGWSLIFLCSFSPLWSHSIPF